MFKKLFCITAVCAVVLASGCASSPKVAYLTNVQQDKEGLIKFRLAQSVILVDWVDPKAKDRIALTAAPVEALGEVFAIKPDSSVGLNTHLKVTKRPNTELIESISTELEDKRIEVLEQSFGVVAGIASFAADASPTSNLPLPIDVNDLYLKKKLPEKSTFTDGKLQNEWTYDITFEAIPSDAIPLDGYKNELSKSTNVLFYSACRSASLRFKSGNLSGQTFTLTIADPNFVQTVALPNKGAIEMHSSCGVNVKSEKADIATSSKLINTVIAQAKSLKDAVNKKGVAGK